MCLAAKDAKTAKNMQSERVFGGLYTGRQIETTDPRGPARFLPASEVIQRVEIAESPVKRAFRGVRPPPVPPTLIDPNHPDSNRP